MGTVSNEYASIKKKRFRTAHYMRWKPPVVQSVRQNSRSFKSEMFWVDKHYATGRYNRSMSYAAPSKKRGFTPHSSCDGNLRLSSQSAGTPNPL